MWFKVTHVGFERLSIEETGLLRSTHKTSHVVSSFFGCLPTLIAWVKEEFCIWCRWKCVIQSFLTNKAYLEFYYNY